MNLVATDPEFGDREDPRERRRDGSDREEGGDPRSRIAVAYLLPASLLIGLGIGFAIDRWQGTAPKWTVAMTLVFMAVGFYHLIKESRR